jgi:SPP1 gp7 family putative phage head morphogenesis protein
MAVTTRTLQLANGLRIQVSAGADAVTRDLVEAWVRAWDEMSMEMRLAVEELLAVDPPRWPTRRQVQRATRAQKALAVANDNLARLAADANVAITDAAGDAVDLAVEAQPHIIASQMPPAAGDAGRLAASFDRVSAQAIEAIVRRSTRQVTSLTRPLSAEATAAMKRSLIRGVAVGQNPRLAAREMLRRLEGDFNGGLTRALVVARTEIIDAHRAGSAAVHKANADVLAGWVWVAQMDKRTCPSCFAQHGNLHPLDEAGPLDHQQGRCARVPQAKSWRELGFDIDEPASAVPDAQTAFARMSRPDQLAVMGPQRLAALDRGDVAWSDLSTRRSTGGWRDSFAPTPVKDLLRA